MKKLFLFVAIVAASFVSCSEDETVEESLNAKDFQTLMSVPKECGCPDIVRDPEFGGNQSPSCECDDE